MYFAWIHLPTVLSCIGFAALGAYVFLKNRRQWVNVWFGIGMGLLAAMEFGNFMALIQLDGHRALFWKKFGLMAEVLVPATWLIFSLSFTRTEPRKVFRQWRLPWFGFTAVSMLFVVVIPFNTIDSSDSLTFLALDTLGQALYIFIFLGYIAVLASLEHTFRSLGPDNRHTHKYLLLGLAGIFAFSIFVTTKVLLYSGVDIRMIPVASSAFLVCSVLIAFSIARHGLMGITLYVSRFVFYRSTTVLIVGSYLLLVGIGSEILRSLDFLPGYPVESLFVFAAIVVLAVVFLSRRVRWEAKTFLARHLYSRQHDYRLEWLKYAEGLGKGLDVQSMAANVSAMLKDSLGVDRVALWITEPGLHDRLFRLTRVGPDGSFEELVVDHAVVRALVDRNEPFSADSLLASSFFEGNKNVINKSNSEIFVPLVAANDLVGIITLGPKVTRQPYSMDDIDLLKGAGAHIAGIVKAAQLSQELVKAKEVEVFHRLSSFLLHDLKNIVSSLSLVVQNAYRHMSDPEFQQDALSAVKHSVEKMEYLVSRLSNGRPSEEPHRDKTDLNALVVEATNHLQQDRSLLNRNDTNLIQQGGKRIELELGVVPTLLLDREQIEKVMVNLVVNALEALDEHGTVTVRTEADGDRALLIVADNGCGMSSEFMTSCLFRPFSSNKKRGLGIGLYQCQSIVHATGARLRWRAGRT